MKRDIGILAFALILTSAALGQNLELDWHTIDGGGQMFSTGGNFELGGTLGQTDASSFNQPMSGGTFKLVGGFWTAATPCAGFKRADANCDGTVDFFDLDAFILAILDPAAYTTNFPGCDYLCVNDANEDGTVDFFDIDPFVACVLNAGCP